MGLQDSALINTSSPQWAAQAQLLALFQEGGCNAKILISPESTLLSSTGLLKQIQAHQVNLKPTLGSYENLFWILFMLWFLYIDVEKC